MAEEYISRQEHEQFKEAMQTEHKQLFHEVDELKGNMSRLMDINANVERLATNMEMMVKEQEKQGKQIEALEERDGQKWRDMVKYVITTLLGAVIGLVLTRIGL